MKQDNIPIWLEDLHFSKQKNVLFEGGQIGSFSVGNRSTKAPNIERDYEQNFYSDSENDYDNDYDDEPHIHHTLFPDEVSNVMEAVNELITNNKTFITKILGK